jgi:hypothetical protein
MTIGTIFGSMSSKYRSRLLQYIFPVTLYLTAFTVPFPHGYNNIFVILLVGAWLISVKKDWGAFKNLPILFGSLVPYYAWYLIGIGYSENIPLGVKYTLDHSIALLIFPLILFTSTNSSYSIKYVLYAFTGGFTFILCFSIIEILVLIYTNN